jgi:spore coat protein A
MSKRKSDFTRRRFLQVGGIAGAGMMLPLRGLVRRAYAAAQGTPLPGSAIPQFIDPLPLLSVAGGPMETIIDDGNEFRLTMQEFQASVMPTGFVPATGTYTGTYVWGYRAGITPVAPAGTYIGPVIVATRNQPTQIRYVNNLPETIDTMTAWPDWTDQTLHWADPLGDGMDLLKTHYMGPVPAVPHLHGGEIPPWIDGGPDAWWTADGVYKGHAYHTFVPTQGDPAQPNEAIYRYPNCQEAANIWFHDHGLGITRINVYAGLAGAYPIIDPYLTLPTGLHPVGLEQGAGGPVDYLVPLVLQDRSFDTNGQLYLQNLGINLEHPFWVPEFVGDTIVVNGKVWPFHSIEPRRYRFLFLNGSNARTYELFLVNPVTKAMGPPLWVIGTDGGYLDTPAKIDPALGQKLLIMPGERYDVIIDFAGLAGQTLILRNTGRTPYPKGAPPKGSTVGQVIQFRVGPAAAADASYDPASGTPLRPPMIRLVDPVAGTAAAGVTPTVRRQLTLNEVMGPGGPLEILVNNTKYDGKSVDTVIFPGGVRPDFTLDPSRLSTSRTYDTTYYSELPTEGDTELWEIINLTADAHPIHFHLVQFQLMNRQNFNVNTYNAAYNGLFPASSAIDPMTGLPYPGGVFIGGYGPPLNYNTGNPNLLGGNPDIGLLGKGGKPVYLQGAPKPPLPQEAGWKDTVVMYPGQVTRLMVRWAPTDTPTDQAGSFTFDPNHGHGYVWHCHIIDHEDNEMMRPTSVTPASGANRTYNPGTDY